MTTPYVPGDLPHLGHAVPAETDIGTLIGRAEPSRAWRIVRMILGVLGIIALAEFVVASIVLLVLAGGIVSRIDQVTTPDPVVTGCPFGPDDCGG